MTTEELQAIKDGAEKMTTEKVANIKTELKADFDNEIKIFKSNSKEEIDAVKKANSDLEAIVVAQGLAIANNKSSFQESKQSVRNLIGNALVENLGEIFKDLNPEKGQTYSQNFNKEIRINDATTLESTQKAALPADPLMNVVNDVPASLVTGGITAGINSDYLLLNAGQRASKTFGKPLLKNNILNYIDVKRLVGKVLYGDVLGVPSGVVTFTPECALKPVIKQDVKIAKKEAGKIAASIRMSEEYLMYIWTAVDNVIMPRYEQMLINALASAIFDGTVGFTGIVSNASTYTVLPGHQIFTTPNLRDVISVHVNSLAILEWNADIIALNPLSAVELSGSKAVDGHYDVFNNGSIQLVDGQMVFVNGGMIPIIFTNSVAPGKIFTASFDAFEVGISDQLIMRMSNCNKDGDFDHNIWTIILEKFCAVLSPVESTSGILYDTIASIKTLITKP